MVLSKMKETLFEEAGSRIARRDLTWGDCPRNQGGGHKLFHDHQIWNQNPLCPMIESIQPKCAQSSGDLVLFCKGTSRFWRATVPGERRTWPICSIGIFCKPTRAKSPRVPLHLKPFPNPQWFWTTPVRLLATSWCWHRTQKNKMRGKQESKVDQVKGNKLTIAKLKKRYKKTPCIFVGIVCGKGNSHLGPELLEKVVCCSKNDSHKQEQPDGCVEQAEGSSLPTC